MCDGCVMAGGGQLGQGVCSQGATSAQMGATMCNLYHGDFLVRATSELCVMAGCATVERLLGRIVKQF